MTTAPTGGTPLNSSERKGDDLTAIKGIKDKRQRLLRKGFNVRTYEDQAALSADEIKSQLEAEGQIVSRDEIGRWIAQAQELVDLSSQRAVEPADADAGEKAISPAEEGEWKPFGSFVVESQARPLVDPHDASRCALNCRLS